ncbi:hypothetical protein GPECTOR_19g256 [Gonium pectorale]|uniref:Uncharacterized protein n=1 Tax=Gonium pectorale TaxID=33097 RepID=A0A150GJC2_GONPE|nr:hypothetical protein GPECTOR_19g256 [Gonium pectorale]|eukprot:KXZ49805.1 hypothetical protein GPECTOR_19g256 [Gonium pectorale]
MHARQSEHDSELLRLDLTSSNKRLQAAENKAAELQTRLETALSDAARGVGSMREQVLELELRLDELRDREEVTSSALELQVREQALLVDALQADLQATQTRAEAAEQADLSKLGGRLSEVEAAEAEDAIDEAAAAQVRAAGLEGRVRELETALVDAESRAAAAAEAETSVSGTLVAQREVQRLQMQVTAGSTSEDPGEMYSYAASMNSADPLVGALRSELEAYKASNAKRTALSKQAAFLGERLAETEIRATRPYHSTLTLSPTRGDATGAGYGPGDSVSASASQQLLNAQHHQQQSSKLDRVVAMWRDACRAKDARLQELQADLTTFSTQLERARADASSLTAKVLEREQALSSCQNQLELTRETLGAQLRAAEEKLAAKAKQVSEMEDDQQARDDELRATRAQLQATQRSLLLLQAEGDAHRDSASITATELANAQKQVFTLQAELRELQQQSKSARTDANQFAEQEHIGVLTDELHMRRAALAKVEAEAAGVQTQLQGREEEVKRLETRLKSAQDGLTSRLDEVSRLQTALRRKEADCEAIETEISAQIADYQRLKQRLLQQERDSNRLSAEQDAVLRRCDELEAALASKQEECALLNRKCAQLEEQWQASRSAMAALQERVRSLDAQSEALQRSGQVASFARQDAAASLDAARAELRNVAQQAATYREQLEQRNNEVRELNAMLQAWEAMRLGKDAQIAALLERCKRHEEDAAEKGRSVEALRRKLQGPVDQDA